MLADRIHQIQASMAAACARRGRPEGSVRLLAATKTVPAHVIREAYACGLRWFGENRVQERQAKHADLSDLAAEWHLLGPLQSNKAARAVSLFDVIESLDSLPLAERLNRLAAEVPGPSGRRLEVLLEINIAGETQKHGVTPAAATELAGAVAALPHLCLRGVMAVPPFQERPESTRPHFAALAVLSERIRAAARVSAADWELSMGMSHDFEVAIEEGATLVRVGTALFGPRPPRPAQD